MSSIFLALFSIAALIRSQSITLGINEGTVSDRVLGESETVYPYFLDFSEDNISSQISKPIMIAGQLENGDEYVLKGENKTEIAVLDIRNLISFNLSEGESTHAIITGILDDDLHLNASQVFFPASIVSSQALESRIARELEDYTTCLDCEGGDVFSCLDITKVSKQAIIMKNGNSITLEYSMFSDDDDFYIISLDILTNSQLVFQDATKLENLCK